MMMITVLSEVKFETPKSECRIFNKRYTSITHNIIIMQNISIIPESFLCSISVISFPSTQLLVKTFFHLKLVLPLSELYKVNHSLWPLIWLLLLSIISVALFLIFKKPPICFHRGCTNLHSHQKHMKVLFSPHSSQHLLLLIFLINAILTGVR